jgi:hypothetical protein
MLNLLSWYQHGEILEAIGMGFQNGWTHFLAIENILEEAGRLKSWVGDGESLDHLPTSFQIKKEDNKPLGPFKFNHA